MMHKDRGLLHTFEFVSEPFALAVADGIAR